MGCPLNASPMHSNGRNRSSPHLLEVGFRQWSTRPMSLCTNAKIADELLHACATKDQLRDLAAKSICTHGSLPLASCGRQYTAPCQRYQLVDTIR